MNKLPIRILILEDDLGTLSVLLHKLSLLEKEFKAKALLKDFSVVTLSEYTQVEEYINKKLDTFNFDAVLLDRDCKVGGSFHVLNIEKIGSEKIISISSVPEYNDQAVRRGIKRVVWKDFNNLDGFADQVMMELQKVLVQ